ncbi:PREDICTED: cytochrome b5 type B isoform X2 [Rhagoletis zephyria]|uniref:cytochrome b5 type B isoform X2 n=1 Tax=Rhagoletis zephyria TaxID=28612 RepID=UPI00081196E8|nr:PREDICTED: cytochrome b5 type B isoform X2 [Rhagoletis zephyria]XP_036338936.1 cytochrome b5 type B isoform X2 [Rhagoletis pomonella]
MAAPKTYNLEAVKQHNTPDDLWIVIEGKVYDVTKFRNEHPGGEETLDEVAGRDATRDFLDVGHSQEARQILKKYYIGDLEASDWTSKLPVRHICCAVGAFATGLLLVIIIRKVLAGK